MQLLRAQRASPARVLVLCPSQQAKENLERHQEVFEFGEEKLEGTRSCLDLGFLQS